MVMTGAVIGFIMAIAYGKTLNAHRDALPIYAFSGALIGMTIGWVLTIVLGR